MKVINFAEEYSLISQYMTELRDVNMQGTCSVFITTFSE